MHSPSVLAVRHYTDRLFHFVTERPDGFRFRSGEFVMLGLPGAGGKPLLRAYSIASPAWQDSLEFFSIKVPDGPLTARLQSIAVGDRIILGKKATGTLVHDALLPGRNLYCLSTGTGIAPFASIIRDPETYDKFERVILTQTCRLTAELQYGLDLVAAIHADELLADLVGDKLCHVTSTTREPSALMGRITTLIDDGRLFAQVGEPPFDPARDRVMICGSMEMLRDCKARCEAAGLVEGSVSRPGQFVIEKAFAD